MQKPQLLAHKTLAWLLFQRQLEADLRLENLKIGWQSNTVARLKPLLLYDLFAKLFEQSYFYRITRLSKYVYRWLKCQPALPQSILRL